VVHVVLAGLPTGLQQFPADTQTKLHELLGKLKAEMMPPYGTPPPYAAMYAQGTPYQQAPCHWVHTHTVLILCSHQMGQFKLQHLVLAVQRRINQAKISGRIP